MQNTFKKILIDIQLKILKKIMSYICNQLWKIKNYKLKKCLIIIKKII